MESAYKPHRSIPLQWVLKIILFSIMSGLIIANRVYYLFSETGNLVAYLGTAIFLGNLFFCLSLLIANWNHFKDIRLFFNNFRMFFPILLKNIKRLLPSTVYIVIEELFWRGYLQAFFFNSILLFPLVTGLFALSHFFKFKNERADFMSVLEFYLYFLMLSYVFHATQSIYAAILIHFIRNMNAKYWSMLKRLNLKYKQIVEGEKCIN